MKFFINLVVLIVAVSAALVDEVDVQFRYFKEKYAKSYGNQVEEAKRFIIFKENLRSIEEHNALYKEGKTTWQKGITKFTDWTDEEYKSMLALQKPNLRRITRAEKVEIPTGLTVPESIDWRERGEVNPVKDQGACAASWAFSLTGSIEAAYFRKTGKLVDLSEQQLLDCSSEVGNRGCKGGYLRETLPYVEWHGLESEDSYPYIGDNQQCQYNESAVVTKIDSFKYFLYNQYALEQIIGNIGPASASINGDYIKDYKSGIFDTDCIYTTSNLAVLIVGYGSENGTNYWIVRNCYGSDWGEDGYFRVIRKANFASCGLYNENVYPIIY